MLYGYWKYERDGCLLSQPSNRIWTYTKGLEDICSPNIIRWDTYNYLGYSLREYV